MVPSSVYPCVVSVVIPAYNAENFVAQAIESVLNQQIESCEILVVNDGSKDKTADVLARFSDRPQVRILTHPDGVNRGVCASRRLALQEARGEFIAFLDADDEYLPGKIARHLKILRENPSVVLVHGPVQLRTNLSAQDVPWTPIFDLGTKSEIYDLTEKPYFLRSNFICNSSIVCRRSALRPEKDTPPNMVAGYEDWVLINCVACRGLFYYDPEPLVIYYVHPASTSSSLFQRPGAIELNSIEFYLSVITRLPRLSMRLRAAFALIYKLIALAEIRSDPAQEPGLVRRILKKIMDRAKSATPRN